MKLWEKGYALDEIVEGFMAGDDPTLDQALVRYDCMGSIAHAAMLQKIGILTQAEFAQLREALHEIMQMGEAGTFSIQQEDEDVHTAVENALVKKIGKVGKKLHTARSRNDQILLDLRLYSRDSILRIAEEALTCCETLLRFAETHHNVPIPGRTHFQRAMPSSLGLWAAAFAEALLDDVELLKGAYTLNDQCPLGSAASYGSSIPIDRQFVADLLGFGSVQQNVLYVNNSRGKCEAVLVQALVQIMQDLAKISTDIILFVAPEFGYLRLPEKFCPGSSLMPQKRNPCPFELIRGKSATVQGALFQILEIVRALPSGYHRDFQETKRPLMQAVDTTWSSLSVFSRLFGGLQVDKEKCMHAFTPELFATDAVLALVQQGIPFRDAYQQIAASPSSVTMQDPVENILSKRHLGATGNLGLERNRSRMKDHGEWVKKCSF